MVKKIYTHVANTVNFGHARRFFLSAIIALYRKAKARLRLSTSQRSPQPPTRLPQTMTNARGTFVMSANARDVNLLTRASIISRGAAQPSYTAEVRIRWRFSDAS